METTPQTVRETLAHLRALPPLSPERRTEALQKFWQQVACTPHPQGSVFPWRHVQRGVVALAASAPRCSEPGDIDRPGVLALILAGNTPLLAWPVLHYCVLLGIPVFIKQSRDETVWTRHFVETLAQIDPEVAALLHLDLFPGDDPRTHTLVQHADAVIAYGSDRTMGTLREITPKTTPFQGFGHALSVGLWTEDGSLFSASLFADDWITYDQAGCLSLQTIFFKNESSLWLTRVLIEGTEEIEDMPPRNDPVECRLVREARDIAAMDGCEVIGGGSLRVTLILHPRPCTMPDPVGFGVLNLIPLTNIADFGRFLGKAKGHLSSVGVAGELSDDLKATIEAEGVSRICRAGEMQTPPLDWRNGGVDLREWLCASLTLSEQKAVSLDKTRSFAEQ